MNLRFPLTLALCGLLLANPIWLLPHVGDRPYRYEAEPFPGTASLNGSAIEGTPGPRLVGVACEERGGHDCGAEAAMAAANRTIGPDAGAAPDRFEPDYLVTKGGYYERYSFRDENGTFRRAWRPVSGAEVARGVAVSVDNLPPDLQQVAREGGSMRRLERLPAQQSGPVRQQAGESLLVRLEGENPRYRVLTVSEEAPEGRVWILVGRVLLGLFGLALVYAEHRRALPDQHATLLYADDRTV